MSLFFPVLSVLAVALVVLSNPACCPEVLSSGARVKNSSKCYVCLYTTSLPYLLRFSGIIFFKIPFVFEIMVGGHLPSSSRRVHPGRGKQFCPLLSSSSQYPILLSGLLYVIFFVLFYSPIFLCNLHERSSLALASVCSPAMPHFIKICPRFVSTFWILLMGFSRPKFICLVFALILLL